jgi:hypothetical protein
MGSSYEHRIIRAALRLEAAEREHDDSAMGEAVVDLVQAARALRRERHGEGSAESYVERED